jgi:plastocyanin
MRPMLFLVAVCLLATAGSSRAASVALQFIDAGGQPIKDAVVRLTGEPAGGAVAPPAGGGTHTIDQSDETFIPYVEIVPIGDDVIFRNSDQTRHHVYSFSPLGLFEFLLAPGDKSPPVRLTRPGVIAVGCNIHDQMIAYLYVSDSILVSLSDANGRADIKDVPAGRYLAHLWHPRLHPGASETTLPITVGTDPATLTATLSLLPNRRPDAEHGHY